MVEGRFGCVALLGSCHLWLPSNTPDPTTHPESIQDPKINHPGPYTAHPGSVLEARRDEPSTKPLFPIAAVSSQRGRAMRTWPRSAPKESGRENPSVIPHIELLMDGMEGGPSFPTHCFLCSPLTPMSHSLLQESSET